MWNIGVKKIIRVFSEKYSCQGTFPIFRMLRCESNPSWWANDFSLTVADASLPLALRFTCSTLTVASSNGVSHPWVYIFLCWEAYFIIYFHSQWKGVLFDKIIPSHHEQCPAARLCVKWTREGRECLI